MTDHSALILTTLKNTSADRLERAILALNASTTTITLCRVSEAEITAVVHNGEGKEYSVSLTPSLAFCGCKDRLYRDNPGGCCKHAALVALHVLRTPPAKKEAPAPQFPMFHLMWRDGIVLCGDPHADRVQMWPWTENMLRWPEACSACVTAYKHPKTAMQVEIPPPDLTLKKTRPGWGFAA